MFHAFASVYCTTGFLWPTLLFFHCFASHEHEVYHDVSVVMRTCTLYHCACTAQVRSRLSFLKLFTDMWSEAGQETCSSSWWCDRNLNLRHTNASSFSYPLYPKDSNFVPCVLYVTTATVRWILFGKIIGDDDIL